MKTNKKTYHLKTAILLLISMFLFNFSSVYGQETMKNAKVSLSFSEEDGAKKVTALAVEEDGTPIEDLELSFYVQRTFSLLPIGGFFNTTDENGEVAVDFPDDLPGDSIGKVKIVVKILESDLYNDLTVDEGKNWGVITTVNDSEEERTLWAASANAPWPLIFATSAMIIGIWIVFWFIISELYKVSKIK
ncbi:hypothetical protein [Lutimonas vermicola]|uniref:Uncharacterized protein n=1 Tax=Lutimonas vermicola TaxID=414288 RepID=A0ABU9KY56_9FLAO